MSADEDTELRDLVAQTLETNGVLGKIRAQLRASVFLALEEQESLQNKTPFENPDLKKFLSTKEGSLVAGLVREFLDFFSLEFTQAVFEPESGWQGGNYEGRGALAKQLNLQDMGSGGKMPLLAELLHNSREEKGTASHQSNVQNLGSWELNIQQLADARKKFEYYDKDNNNEIDKDELRELFIDMFPSFNRHMLERYVNDEFKATDRDFSNSISFEEFITMYKRLFLQCRSVVAGDVAGILSPTSPNKSVSSPMSKASNSERSLLDSRNQRNLENGGKQLLQDNNNTDTEEDFFDDPIPPTSPGFRSFSNEEKGRDKPTSNGLGGPKSGSPLGRGSSGGGMSSLSGLPSLTGERPARKSPTGDSSENLRAMDKRMADLGLDGDAQDYSYEDDFQSEGHSISQKSPRARSEARSQNGSIAEEIEEDIDEFSIEGDDLLRSEKSGYDDMTTDRTISQHESGFDYMEDLQSQ